MLQRILKQRNRTAENAADSAQRLKKNVVRQIVITVWAFLLVAVLIFAISLAWYTNVSQMHELQFQTEVWGFNKENVVISSDSVSHDAAPGMSGIVPLTIDNGTGTSAVKASVTVSKAAMDTELQKRIYFYVDASKTYTFSEEPSETVSKVYLGSAAANNYLYELSAGEMLSLSESYCTDVPLKWAWVYDMEGYIFRGTVTDKGAAVEEYLRPLEYNLDEAVFDIDSTSETYDQLIRIGEVSVTSYLQHIFDTDGYAGTLKQTSDGEIESSVLKKVNGKIYYRVSVDENGTGIWAYLCTGTEIQQGIEYDSQFGEKTEADMTAAIQVTVSNVQSSEIDVNSAEELQSALQLQDSQGIRLTQSLTLAAPITLSEGSKAVINLNGYSVIYGGEEASYTAFSVGSGAKLTLINGSLIGNGNVSSKSSDTASVAVTSNGGAVTLSGITVSSIDTAVVADDRTSGGDSVIKIFNCDFLTNSTAVKICGNGQESATQSRVIIQNSTIQSDYVGVSGQEIDVNDDQCWGIELVLINDNITGQWAGVYQPQQKSNTTISGCTVSGYTGVVIKGGTMSVDSSKITGTGAHNDAAAKSDGWTDTGDGAYVVAENGWEASLILRGAENEITSNQSYAVELFGVADKGPGKLVAEGGTFSGSLGKSNWNQIGVWTVPEE